MTQLPLASILPCAQCTLRPRCSFVAPGPSGLCGVGWGARHEDGLERGTAARYEHPDLVKQRKEVAA
jgi:hypothetical protein